MHYIRTIYLTGNNNPIINHCTKLIILCYNKVEQRRHEAGHEDFHGGMLASLIKILERVFKVSMGTCKATTPSSLL